MLPGWYPRFIAGSAAVVDRRLTGEFVRYAAG